MKNILVTGGTGYIGSHILVELIKEGYEVVVYDNLSNSLHTVLNNVFLLTGKNIEFIKGDITDFEKLDTVFKNNKFDAVIHLAGLKSVSESVEQPLNYYKNNVFGSLQLFEVMALHNVKVIVFSSSATVYGEPKSLPLNEEMPMGIPTNPYGMSKLVVENILADLFYSDPSWSIIRLRYFNPVGAHPSGFLGENPVTPPNNLMPIIIQTALGKKNYLPVFGGDYPTDDGTAVRDYIHVVDLAKGHIAALRNCSELRGIQTINLGTGQGYSVKQIIETFEKENNVEVPYKIMARRQGDVAECYSQVNWAKKLLGWESKLGIKEMCKDSWNWAIQNKSDI